MKQRFTMTDLPVEALPAFIAVAELRSFTAAADQLAKSPSAVSQTIRNLENQVGTSLFSRTTRSVALTEAGQIFLDQIRPAMEAIGDSFTVLGEYASRPSGLLRLNASRGVLRFLLSPVEQFSAVYPEIDVELFADDSLTDIVGAGFDAGIRMGETLQPDMVAIRLAEPFRFVVVGSPDYFARHSAPLGAPDDLASQQCITFRMAGSGRVAPWGFAIDGHEKYVPVDGRLIVNDTPLLIAAALHGMGLVQVAEPLVAGHVAAGRLRTVLDAFSTETPGMYLYYPKRNTMVPKLRAFVDFIRDYQREQRPLLLLD